MRPVRVAFLLALSISLPASIGLAQHSSTSGPYKVLKTAKVGGEGGFDYISADVEGRRLYVPRNGPMGQLTVFNLDTLEPAGSIAGIKSGGAAVDPKSHHGFSTTKPITMWDSKTLQVIKMIEVDGHPDGITFDPFNERVWVLSHMAPYATVIDAKEGTVAGTIDLGGQPEQAVSDGKGTVYVNIDAKNHVLFSYWRLPSPVVVIVNAENGNIITSFPTDVNVDTVAFNPATMEAISTAGGGSIVFIKENSPTSFEVEQRLQTMVGARNMVLDTKTNHVLSMAFEYGPLPADAPPPVPGRMALGPPLPGSFTILMVGKQ